MRYPCLFSLSILTFAVSLAMSGCGGTPIAMNSNSTAPTGTPPTVIAAAEQVNGVATNRKQEVQFSEAMNPATINAQSFQVTDSSGKLAQGTVSYDPDFETASFLPNPALQTGATYTATITTAVASTGGMHLASSYSYSFSTRSDADTSPLIINSVSPAANATCVSATTPITITFDEAPDASTVNSTNTVVTGPDGAVIPVNMSINVATTQVVLTPKSALPSGTITVTVKNVGDLADVMMAGPYIWSFSTACGGGGTGGGGTSGSGAQVSFSTTTYSGANLPWNYLLLPNGTVIADLNGDERDDFATSGWCPNGTNGTFSVRLSTGDGAYGPPTCYTIPTAPLNAVYFAAGDFFGNGHTDVAVEDEKGNVSIWKNATGDGTLTLASSMAAPSGESGMLAADVNHDGKVDLVFDRADATTGNGGILNVFFGNGDGTFTAGPSTTVTTQTIGSNLFGGDFDGDGKVDIAVLDSLGEKTEILYGDGTGKFIAGPNLQQITSATGDITRTWYQPFDVNADGIMDLIGSPFTQPPSCGTGCSGPTPTGNNYLDIEFGHPDRTLTSQRVSLANCASSAHPPQVADFDGDGIPDIIVAEAPCQGGASEMLDFLKGNGNGTFQSEQVIYTTNDLIPEWFVMKASASGKPGLAVYQYQDVNRTVTNPEELIMVNTTP
jgi:hypothetical protein